MLLMVVGGLGYAAFTVSSNKVSKIIVSFILDLGAVVFNLKKKYYASLLWYGKKMQKKKLFYTWVPCPCYCPFVFVKC